MTDIVDWYKNIPRFTKYWLSGTMLISILARFGILPSSYLILHSHYVFHYFQIWRPFTALLFYPLTPQTGFHYMLNCYFLYNYSIRLERDHFKTSPADYLYLLIINWIFCVISGFCFDLMILMDPMVLSVLYVWCQLNSEAIVNFWFGTRFKAMYLPWVLLLINLVLSGGGLDSILGICIGHLYFFLKFKYPQDFGGRSFLTTPQFIKSYFPDIQGGVHGFGGSLVTEPRTTRPNVTQNIWGRGNLLGRD